MVDGYAGVLGSAAGGHGEGVPLWETLVFAGLLVGLILSLALEEKIHAKKSVIACVFGGVCLLLGTAMGLLPFEDVGRLVIGGHEVSLPVYVPGIDWGVIAIILGSGIFVDVTSKSGLFTWVAIKLTKASKGRPGGAAVAVRGDDRGVFCRAEQRDGDDHRGVVDGSVAGEVGASGEAVGVFVDRGAANERGWVADPDQLGAEHHRRAGGGDQFCVVFCQGGRRMWWWGRA